MSLPFADIRAITRLNEAESQVTLRDGSDRLWSGTQEVGEGNRGLFVEDSRFGRVTIRWDAFESVEFFPAPELFTYDDFPAARRLTGSVTDLASSTFKGQLIFDLDESLTSETLDAPRGGVTYNLPFGMVRTIRIHQESSGTASWGYAVELVTDETLVLEAKGDLSMANGGMLVLPQPSQLQESGARTYVAWKDVREVRFAKADG